MKRFDVPNINTPTYWDSHQTAMDFGLRQREYVALAGSGHKIIELGCGLSPTLHYITTFQERWGLDFSQRTVDAAHLQYPNINYVVGNATDTPFRNLYFDVSIAAEIIEHLEYPKMLLDEMARITKRRMIVSTPQLEFNDPEHLWEFKAGDLEKLMSVYGKVKTFNRRSARFPGRKYIFAVCEL